MNKSGFSYLKLTAFGAGLAITLIGLSGLLSVATIAQEEKETIERVTAPDRQIDLRTKLKDKKFADGRRVVIETLDSGEKLVAEVKAGKFLNWFLVATDGTEGKGEVKVKHVTTDTVATCSATVTHTTVTTNWRGKVKTITSTHEVIQVPCFPGTPGAY